MGNKLAADENIADELVGEDATNRVVKAGEDSKRPRLVVKSTMAMSDSLRNDFNKFADMLKEDEPCVLCVRVKDKKLAVPAEDLDVALIAWAPASAHTSKQRLFAASLVSLKDVFPDSRIAEMTIHKKEDLTVEKFLESVQVVTGAKKPVFYDMKHSANAARIRLWFMLKDGVRGYIETRMMTPPDLKKEEFLNVNPLGRVPAFVREDTSCVYESNVILQYLEDKYSANNPSLMPGTPEERQDMNMLIRLHDMYIASSKNVGPGFTSTIAALYVSIGFHGKETGMDLATRAAKLAGLWRTLKNAEAQIAGPFLVGPKMTLADLTWFPTCAFMEFVLPRVFKWPDLFGKKSPLPKLAAWWAKIGKDAPFTTVRQQIHEYWGEMEGKGLFKHIVEEVAADTAKLKFQYP